jgi:Tol biopolymer transport system component
LVLLLQLPFSISPLCTRAQVPSNAGALLQAGIEKENVDGNLKEAIEIYRKLSADTLASRDIRSRALLRLAECEEKQGHQAKQVYEQLVHDFGDQPAAVPARRRLAQLTQQERPLRLVTMSDRKIEWARLGAMGPADTDGERAVYAVGDRLYLGDLAGRNKRLIVNTKRYSWVPCRDFSMVLLDLLPTPSRQHTLGVIRTDGTGYRTLIRDDAKNSIFQQDQPFAMSWSWDNRNVLLSGFSLKSTIAGQLWLVSVADGDHRVLVDEKGGWIRKAALSPDGRFAAYEVWPKDAASPQTSRVFVVPMDGGKPRMEYESAPWQVGNAFFDLMDWTADGQNLILRDVQRGKSALYVLPMKDGLSSGPAKFVRFGDFDDGYTTASGALVYEDKGASPFNMDVSIAPIDQEDRFESWSVTDLNTNGASHPWPSFSPDGTQIAYVAQNADPALRDLIVRDLATGKERQIYRSLNGSIACQFSPRNPKVFCSVEKDRNETDLIEIAVDSGVVEKIATISGSRLLLSVARGDQSFILSGNASQLGVFEPPILQFDRATQQETTIEPPSEDRRLASVSSDGHFIARLLDGTVSIRTVASANWKALAFDVTANVPPFVSPDGKWVLYQTVNSAGQPGLFRVPADGGKPERVGDLPNHGSGGALFFSPDGHQVLAVAEKRVSYGLSVLENFVPVKEEHEQ